MEPVRPCASSGIRFRSQCSSSVRVGDIRLVGNCQFEPCRQLPAATTAPMHSSPPFTRTHLVPGKHVNSLANPKPTEPASLRNIKGPPSSPLPGDSQAPRVRGSVMVSVPINVPESSLSKAGHQCDWDRFSGQAVPSHSYGVSPSPQHIHRSPADAKTTPGMPSFTF